MTTLIISSSAILVSLIISLLTYKKLEPSWLRLFVYFLFLSFSIQISGYVYSLVYRKSNHFIFNLLIILEFIFYFYAFSKAMSRKNFKLFIRASGLIFILFSLYNIIWGESFFRFNTHTYTLGSLLILASCLLYFIELFISDAVINFFRIPMFWISTGLFFFYVGNFMYLSLLSYIDKNNIDPNGKVYASLLIVLDIMLYSLFAIGFLCNQKWKRVKY